MLTLTPSDAPALLDLVVPVYNEEVDLEPSLRRLHRYLSASFPYTFQITVADNASTDATLAVAHAVAAELPGIRVVHLAEKGRGRALRSVWLASRSPVLGYLDADLSTDSRVEIVATACADLAGIARLGRSLATRSLPLAGLRQELGRGPLSTRDSLVGRQAVRFAAIGVASTVAYLALFALLRPAIGAQAANALALLATAVANTATNRRVTFGISGRRHVLRHQAQGLVVFGLGLGLTSGALAALHAAAPAATAGAELAVVVTANLAATGLRFVLLRLWLYGSHRVGITVETLQSG